MLKVRSIATGWIEPSPSWNGVSSDLITSRVATITATTRSDQETLTTARSPLSAKNSVKTRITAAMKKSTIQSGGRNHALGAVDPVVARLLPRRGLLEPLVVRGLFCVRLGVDRLERPEERATPQGLIVSPAVPASMRGHS